MHVGLGSEEGILKSLRGFNVAGSKRVENYKLQPTVNARVRHHHYGETEEDKNQTGRSKSFCPPLAFHSPSPIGKASLRQRASKEETWFRGSAPDSQSRVYKGGMKPRDDTLIICSPEEAESSCRIRFTDYLKLLKDVYGILVSFLHSAW